jgi:hypothetical protein
MAVDATAVRLPDYIRECERFHADKAYEDAARIVEHFELPAGARVAEVRRRLARAIRECITDHGK